jgi:hypothetical protein
VSPSRDVAVRIALADVAFRQSQRAVAAAADGRRWAFVGAVAQPAAFDAAGYGSGSTGAAADSGLIAAGSAFSDGRPTDVRADAA